MLLFADATQEENNCGTYAALFYFISYIIVVTIILLNLFTAVIIETFEKTHNQVYPGVQACPLLPRCTKCCSSKIGRSWGMPLLLTYIAAAGVT